MEIGSYPRSGQTDGTMVCVTFEGYEPQEVDASVAYVQKHGVPLQDAPPDAADSRKI